MRAHLHHIARKCVFTFVNHVLGIARIAMMRAHAALLPVAFT
jgi:hypothetical protein